MFVIFHLMPQILELKLILEFLNLFLIIFIRQFDVPCFDKNFLINMFRQCKNINILELSKSFEKGSRRCEEWSLEIMTTDLEYKSSSSMEFRYVERFCYRLSVCKIVFFFSRPSHYCIFSITTLGARDCL